MASLETATKKAKRAATKSATHLNAARREAVYGARGVASELREVAEDNVDTARRYGRDKANEVYDSATSAIDRGFSDIEAMVRRNPVASLATALVIGFVLGARR